MKQFTTPEQTAKLIELGFEKPKMAAPALKWVDGEPTFEPQYTIGELIEMMPEEINNDILPDRLGVYIDHNKMWAVDYSNVLGSLCSTYRTELIDALFDMIVTLKEDKIL